MHDEFIEIENSLKKKCKNEYDSEYSYELGLILANKLKEYKIVESTRSYFWELLRNGVNSKDKRKVFQAKQRDPYEYDYMLSKLPKELVIKYSRSKWDHLFDITTVRNDKRIYDWLLKVNNNDFVNNQLVFQNFCKGVKDYISSKDTLMLSDAELFNIYDEIMHKSIILVNFMKDKKIKFNSKQKTEYFNKAKKISSSNTKELDKILNLLKEKYA